MKDPSLELLRYDERCASALDEALGEVDAYRSWRPFDLGRAAPLDARFAALPALTKQEMRLRTPAAYVAPGLSLERGLASGEVELVSTSGTTAEKIANAWYQPWWDRSERASWALNAHAARAALGNHREAILSSPICVGFESEHGDLPYELRRLGRFLFLNDRVDPAWPESHCERMLAELERFAPVVLEANPSLLSRLSRWARRRGVRPYQPALIVLTYEFASLIHRRQIGQVFDAPIVSSYGSTETGYVFVECEQGCMHQNVESCRVDFLPFASESGAASPLGKLLVTTFGNPWRALIRFDVGDLAKLTPEPCPCGRRAGLTLTSIEGRTINATVAPDGQIVSQAEVDRALAEVPDLDDYQVSQLDPCCYLVRVVSDNEAARERVVAASASALRAVYGPKSEVRGQLATELPPESSGKFRLVRPAEPLDLDRSVLPSLRPPVLEEVVSAA